MRVLDKRAGVLRHFRLLGAAAAGVLVFFLAPAHWPATARVLVGWNFSVMAFVAWVFLWMKGLSAKQICVHYVDEDATAGIILVGVIIAALLSLVAIVLLLSTLKQVSGAERAVHVALAALTVVNSWTLVPTMFTLHYADAFYSEPDNDRPLHFPQTKMPVFWDFAYFSFTIAAACQTADVATTGTAIRRTVLAHTVISFLFNVSILGFAINITAGLFAGG
ncbi:MAG: hypothetical protein JWN85_612 [Gammaproteobacteria bacterium]|nr:hypothetical protein [Gammaproteobacteria bacterium]